MKLKTMMGITAAGVLLGVGVLAGSVIGTAHVSAQTPSASATATAVPGKGGDTQPANPPSGKPFGGRHGMGGGFGPGGMGMGMDGPGGRGGHGPGRDGRDGGGLWGDNATADGAARQISNTTTIITQVKADLDYAKGKMDTADVERWISGADSLLKSAQSAQSSSQYGQAVGYANAAAELARVADQQMAQKLGADKLPSYSQRPQHPGKMGNPNAPGTTTATVTQAQASRVLQNTYNRLIEQGALIKSASSAGSASTYLTEAQNAYKAAYAAYGAGNYSDAVASARLAGELAEVAQSVLRASNAPADSNTPVTVPAPNFQ